MSLVLRSICSQRRSLAKALVTPLTRQFSHLTKVEEMPEWYFGSKADKDVPAEFQKGLNVIDLDEPIAKTPEELIAEVPVIEWTDGQTAICTGGEDPAYGHPVEYIQLHRSKPGVPEICKYCGLRYVAGSHH